MKVDILLPQGIDRYHRLLYFHGIIPTKESYHMEVYIDWNNGETMDRVGAIYSYGFGEAMDEQGRILLGLPNGQTSLEAPPSFDAFIELPEDLAERIPHSPEAKLIGLFPDHKNQDENTELFAVQSITVEPV
jgi:hypothetical protein